MGFLGRSTGVRTAWALCAMLLAAQTAHALSVAPADDRWIARPPLIVVGEVVGVRDAGTHVLRRSAITEPGWLFPQSSALIRVEEVLRNDRGATIAAGDTVAATFTSSNSALNLNKPDLCLIAGDVPAPKHAPGSKGAFLIRGRPGVWRCDAAPVDPSRARTALAQFAAEVAGDTLTVHWRRDTDWAMTGSFKARRDQLLVLRRHGAVSLVSAATGDVLAECAVPATMAGAARGRDMVWISDYDNYVTARRLPDLGEVWTTWLGGTPEERAAGSSGCARVQFSVSAPVVVGNDLYVASANGHLYKLSAADGVLQSTSPIGDYSGGPFVVSNGIAVVAAQEYGLIGIDLASRARLWRLRGVNARSVAAWPNAPGAACVATDDGRLLGLDLLRGRITWESPASAGGHWWGQLLLDQGTCLFGTGEKLFAVDALTGAVLWSRASRCRFPASLRGVVLAATNDGRLESLSWEDGALEGTLAIPDGIVAATPLVLDGAAIIDIMGNDTGRSAPPRGHQVRVGFGR